MNDNKRPPTEAVSHDTQAGNPRSYSFLLRLSKRLGKVATGSFVEMRQFLNQEITVSSSNDRFLYGMPRIRLQRPIMQEESGALPGKSAPKKQMRSAKESREGSRPEISLEKIIAQSREILASANTVFPLTLFPDTIFVDRTKITIVRRDFFWSSDTLSMRIEDVLNVSATIGPLFGSLTIASRVMSTIDHFQINHLWRNDAIHLKHVIQGYVIAQHNKIDTAHLSKDELIRTLVEFGSDSNSVI